CGPCPARGSRARRTFMCVPRGSARTATVPRRGAPIVADGLDGGAPYIELQQGSEQGRVCTMERFGGRQLTERVEDGRLLIGQGLYGDDLRIDGALHVVFVRSTCARARLRGIDAEAARAMPGVRAIWTGADLANDGVE